MYALVKDAAYLTIADTILHYRTEVEEEEFSPAHPLGQAVQLQRQRGYRVVTGRLVRNCYMSGR